MLHGPCRLLAFRVEKGLGNYYLIVFVFDWFIF